MKTATQTITIKTHNQLYTKFDSFVKAEESQVLNLRFVDFRKTDVFCTERSIQIIINVLWIFLVLKFQLQSRILEPKKKTRECKILKAIVKESAAKFTSEDVQPRQHMVSDGKLINIPLKGLDSYYAVDTQSVEFGDKNSDSISMIKSL